MIDRPATPQPFELAAPDLGSWRQGNTGTEGVWRFESGRPGRNVMVTALVHGNELCGAWALLEALKFGLRPDRGALSFVFANLAAFDRFDAANTDASRFVDHDLNRLWGSMTWAPEADLDAPSPNPATGRNGDTPMNAEQQRVLQLRPFVEQADWLLDLHSMHQPGPPLGLTGMLAHHAHQAAQLGGLPWLVADAGHRAGTRLRDHGHFGDANRVDSFALLVECGWHGATSSRHAALNMLSRFLAASGVVDASALPPDWRQPEAGPPSLLQVTDAVTVREGAPPAFTEAWATGQSVPAKGTWIGTDGIDPVVTPYDDCVLVMPSLQHATPGATLVRFAKRFGMLG